MADKAWKQMERRIAGFFGALRVPGSGSMGRRDLSRSDSTHERLFIECKALQRFSVLNIWREAAKHAAAEAARAEPQGGRRGFPADPNGRL